MPVLGPVMTKLETVFSSADYARSNSVRLETGTVPGQNDSAPRLLFIAAVIEFHWVVRL